MVNETRIIVDRPLTDDADYNPLPIIWVESFDFPTSTTFIKALTVYEADNSVQEIFMYVTSYGGEVMPLIAMIDAMLSCSKPIHSVMLGTAASCGAFLAACAPGTRFIGANTSLHLHHVRAMVYEDLPGLEQEAKTINKIEAKLFKLLAKRAGTTMSAIKKELKEENREWNLQAEDAIEWNFADIIGIPRLSSSLIVKCEY